MRARCGRVLRESLRGATARWRRRRAAAARLAGALALALSSGAAATAAEIREGLAPCRLPGVEHAAWCGSLKRPLDPAQPAGLQIDVHYAVLPALARNRRPDPVFLFAGGPGQSAIELAPSAARLFGRLLNRRDVVLVDQRGTGRSSPLACPPALPTAPLAEQLDGAAATRRLQRCLQALQRTPAGVLRHYATWIAVQDVDAVRQALGVERLNAVGGSYGTRAALEYLRQFPRHVRRMVLDGVAPPDMALPAAARQDTDAALGQVFAACAAEVACAARFPRLRADWQALVTGSPWTARLAHPLTGTAETVVVDADSLRSMVRAALYVPALAAGVPAALDAAARGRWDALAGLVTASGSRRQGRVYEGLHFAVVCAEDAGAQASPAAAAEDAGGLQRQYREVCAGLPPVPLPQAFRTVGVSPVPVLLLSGGADPVTPPRHGQRVAAALGAQARHVVVPQAGHGLLSLPCLREAVFRFVDAPRDDDARQVEAGCAQALPRPPAFVPLESAAAAVGAGPAR